MSMVLDIRRERSGMLFSAIRGKKSVISVKDVLKNLLKNVGLGLLANQYQRMKIMK